MSTIEEVYRACCETHFPLPNDVDISNLERRLRVNFPLDYRAFIQSYNGGYFSYPDIVFAVPITVKWRDGLVTLESVGLEVLNGFNSPHPTFTLGSQFDVSLFDNNDPLKWLVIGHTQAGCLLLLDMIPGEVGAILIKFPDENAYRIADGIEEFFGLIELPPRSGDA